MARHTRHDIEIAARPRRQPERRWPAQQAGRNRTEQLHLAVVRPVARRALVPGTVVMAHVPFEEAGGWKLRPAVVRSVDGRSVTVLPATSADSRHRYPHRHHELADPGAAGLLRATAVRIAEVTLDLVEVVSVVGRLGDEDHEMLFGTAAGTVDSAMALGLARPRLVHRGGDLGPRFGAFAA